MMGILDTVKSRLKAWTGYGEWQSNSLRDGQTAMNNTSSSGGAAVVLSGGGAGNTARLFRKRSVLLLRNYAEFCTNVRSAIDIYRNCIEQAAWQITAADPTRPMNDRVRREIEALLKTPNPARKPYSTIQGEVVEDFLVVGHGGMEFGIRRDLTPWGIFTLDAGRLAFVKGWDGTDPAAPRYCELTESGRVGRWIPDQMAAVLVNRPRSYDSLGLSHVECLDVAVRALLEGSDQFLSQMVDRTPGGAFDIGEGYTKPQVDAFRQEITQLRNFFAVISGGKNSKFIPFNASEKDLRALDKLMYFKRMVAAIFQLPLASLGETVDTSRANTEAMLRNADNGPGALLWRIKEMENAEIVSKYGPVEEHNCCIDYPIMSSRDEKQQSEVSKTQTANMPWVTINQAARDAGKPTFDSPIADDLLIPTRDGPVPLRVLEARYYDDKGKLKEEQKPVAPPANDNAQGDASDAEQQDAEAA
jgi:hypothetical protein